MARKRVPNDPTDEWMARRSDDHTKHFFRDIELLKVILPPPPNMTRQGKSPMEVLHEYGRDLGKDLLTRFNSTEPLLIAMSEDGFGLHVTRLPLTQITDLVHWGRELMIYKARMMLVMLPFVKWYALMSEAWLVENLKEGERPEPGSLASRPDRIEVFNVMCVSREGEKINNSYRIKRNGVRYVGLEHDMSVPLVGGDMTNFFTPPSGISPDDLKEMTDDGRELEAKIKDKMLLWAKPASPKPQ